MPRLQVTPTSAAPPWTVVLADILYTVGHHYKLRQPGICSSSVAGEPRFAIHFVHGDTFKGAVR